MLKAVSNAYEEIAASLPDLLILDITLEHPDVGWLVLDKVKLDPATFDIPVIICSAAISAIRDNQDRLKRLGCFVVEKPFDIDELLAVTAQHSTKAHMLQPKKLGRSHDHVRPLSD